MKPVEWVRQEGGVMRKWGTILAAWTACAVAVSCSGGAGETTPAAGFGMLSGRTVLVLPVQYVRRVPGGWVGGAANEGEAARQADTELSFALSERGGRAVWVTADQQVRTLRRRPSIDVDPNALSADEARREGAELEDVKDPLRSEIRMLAALFDCRYAILPLEIGYEFDEESQTGSLGIVTLLIDVRRARVLWGGVIADTSDQPPGSAGALASLAQQWADVVAP
jgi:hypothetical protein